jgi:hypothetical protein
LWKDGKHSKLDAISICISEEGVLESSDFFVDDVKINVSEIGVELY